jgi:hypothetical protein
MKQHSSDISPKSGNSYNKIVQVGDFVSVDDSDYNKPVLGKVTQTRPLSFDISLGENYSIRCLWSSVIEHYTPENHPEFYL